MTNSLKMQTLRKKTSPLKYKNETSRFLGEGVSFKAKLIGILEVSEARGDRMCQDALSDLKMAIRAAGEHKQRIIINIAIDGLRLRDEKTGDSLYHHPVHKISFIAQDMTDTRAFGYIFGSPETGHRFFGIKTDKAASQVVIAMRDLFQVVFALKKKEIELAKQHLDKGRYSSSPLFSETSLITTKGTEQTSTKTINEHKPLSATTSNKSGNEAVADLVDLELELNNLQQGLTQMERITPSDPFGSKEDPFGDSFTAYPQKPILPPPPSGRDRSSRNSETSSRTPATASSSTVSAVDKMTNKVFTFSQDFSTSFEDHSSGDWFTPPASNSVAEEPPLIAKPVENADANRVESQFDVFTELDPLGTGKSKPYVDKKLFFQELKNPPKKVLNDLVPQIPELNLLNSFTQSTKPAFPGADVFPSDPFQEDPFKEDPFAETDFSKQDPFNTDYPGLNLLVKDSLSSLSKSPQFIAQPVKETFQYAYSDMSTESVPEPPPRPSNNVQEIKPPPLPPKKQPGELLIKPPPRPPHVDEFHREESITQPKDCPPLPVPLRKPKTDSRHHQSDEDYLTPVGFKPTGMQSTQVTIASILESKPNLTVTTASENLDSLDITLSQLTLSGLNELAKKLNIPAEQLSNMTLVQLTSYISNFVKNASSSAGAEEPFKADFAANFGGTTSNEGSYDRYAVFRELFQEENHDNKVQDEEQLDNKQQQEQKVLNTQFEEQSQTTDKYAALREIVEMEIKQIETENLKNVETDFETEKESNIIEYNTPLDKKENEKEEILSKSPTGKRSIKSPIPQAVTEVIQKSTHLTSGSLSDAVSGSSPEIDNTGSTSEIVKKGNDIAGESWAIFEKPNLNRDDKIKQRTQSEEGVSPWSSDSKEFANGSPPEWRQRVDSSSGGDHVYRREQEDWWDTSAEPEAVYNPANRRSTDSYEDEYYDYYDRPRRRRQVFTGTGGHSSSSRDVSPWEEEPHRREPCDHREPKQNWARHSRIHAFDRYRNRRHNDSWDEEDDYEYEEEHSGRFHWPDRHVKAERDRHSREHDDYYGEGWEEGRKYRRRRELDRDRWCCPDWETEFQGKTSARYPSGRTSNPDQMVRHEKELEEHYYSRDSQESPWDEDEEPRPPHYATTKRNWKQRPSSASETERKTSDGKFRQQYLGMGGSDGERERRSKPNRRSKSRDSQFSDSTYNRHKVEPLPPMRTQHRLKQHPPAKEPDFVPPKKADTLRSDKKNSSLPRKKSKEEPRTGTYPRKKPTFENDFTPPDVESPRTKCSFDSNFGGSSKKSFFEDNFSPTEQSDTFRESKICSILEEPTEEYVARLQKVPHSKKKILNRNRFSGDIHLKKSDSVNIFARENDPFDDDFFSSGRNAGDLSWSDNFDEQT